MDNLLIRAPLASPPNVYGETRDVGSDRPAPSAWIGDIRARDASLTPDHVDLSFSAQTGAAGAPRDDVS
jgi:hypothetical protein